MAEAEKKECPKCRDTGWVQVPVERGTVARRCSCITEKAAATALEKTRIPARYRDCTLQNFESHDDSQEDALKISKKFIANFPIQKVGLLFIGPPGVGKTHLAAAILFELVKKKNAFGVFYDFRDLIRDIQSSFEPDSEVSQSEILAPVFECDILVLDELGARRSSTWVEDTVFYIINRRYNEQKVTIFTSNFLDASEGNEIRNPLDKRKPEETLVERIGYRLRSRIYEMCKVVKINGEDYRKVAKQGSYHF